jgi:hypothetical protein
MEGWTEADRSDLDPQEKWCCDVVAVALSMVGLPGALDLPGGFLEKEHVTGPGRVIRDKEEAVQLHYGGNRADWEIDGVLNLGSYTGTGVVGVDVRERGWGHWSGATK